MSPPTHATGKTNVKVWQPKPQDGSQPGEGAALVQVHLEEDFSGDIQGNGVAESLWAQLADDAASMVAMLRVTGNIDGRSGTFILQGQGTVQGATLSATWFVVPGSGTGQLSGLRGEGGFRGQRGQQSDITLDYWFE